MHERVSIHQTDDVCISAFWWRIMKTNTINVCWWIIHNKSRNMNCVNRAVLVLTPVTITHETGYFVSPLVTLSVLRSSSVIHACSLSLKLHLLPIVLLRCLQSASVQAVKDKLQQETHLHSSCDRTIIRPMTDTYSIWVMLLKGIRSVKSCTFT